MTQPAIDLDQHQVINIMTELTRANAMHRIIVAGSDADEFYLAFRRRGFLRVATVRTCRSAQGQHSVGFIAEQRSLAAQESALAQISDYLSPTAAVAILFYAHQTGFSLKIRDNLEQLGFRIEAGVRCRQGFVLSAHRRDLAYMAKVA